MNRPTCRDVTQLPERATLGQHQQAIIWALFQQATDPDVTPQAAERAAQFSVGYIVGLLDGAGGAR